MILDGQPRALWSSEIDKVLDSMSYWLIQLLCTEMHVWQDAAVVWRSWSSIKSKKVRSIIGDTRKPPYRPWNALRVVHIYKWKISHLLPCVCERNCSLCKVFRIQTCAPQTTLSGLVNYFSCVFNEWPEIRFTFDGEVMDRCSSGFLQGVHFRTQ